MDHTDRAKTVQPWLTKQKSHEIFRFTASTVDIPNRWNPRAKQSRTVALLAALCAALWVAFADFSAAPWQALKNQNAAPTTPPCFCRRQRSSSLLFKSLPSCRQKEKPEHECVLVFLGAMEGTRTPGLLIRSARRAISSIFGSYVLSSILCEASQVLSFEFLHPLSDFATICTLCTF